MSEDVIKKDDIQLDIKYRPKRFSEVCGNQDVLLMLKNHIKFGTLPPVIFFCGQPGLAKTTLSFVMTSAILCNNTQDGEPCGVCASCIAIQETLYVDGNAVRGMDVYTFNMSSHESSDAYVRHIASVVSQAPREGRRKVILIDELHKATIDQQEGLNGILEFPPKGVYIIICTSFLKKIAESVQKRGIILQLNTPDSESLLKRLRRISLEEAIEISDSEILKIMKVANNNGRQSVKYLQEVINGGKLAVRAIVDKASVNIELYIQYFTAIRLGILAIMEFVEDILKNPGSFFGGLDDFIYLVMRTRYHAGSVVDDKVRKDLKTTMVFFTDSVLMNILKQCKGAGYLTDDDARKVLFLIGFEANPRIEETIEHSDEHNAIVFAQEESTESLLDEQDSTMDAFSVALSKSSGINIEDL